MSKRGAVVKLERQSKVQKKDKKVKDKVNLPVVSSQSKSHPQGFGKLFFFPPSYHPRVHSIQDSGDDRPWQVVSLEQPLLLGGMEVASHKFVVDEQALIRAAQSLCIVKVHFRNAKSKTSVFVTGSGFFVHQQVILTANSLFFNKKLEESGFKRKENVIIQTVATRMHTGIGLQARAEIPVRELEDVDVGKDMTAGVSWEPNPPFVFLRVAPNIPSYALEPYNFSGNLTNLLAFGYPQPPSCEPPELISQKTISRLDLNECRISEPWSRVGAIGDSEEIAKPSLEAVHRAGFFGYRGLVVSELSFPGNAAVSSQNLIGTTAFTSVCGSLTEGMEGGPVCTLDSSDNLKWVGLCLGNLGKSQYNVVYLGSSRAFRSALIRNLVAVAGKDKSLWSQPLQQYVEATESLAEGDEDDI